MGGSVITWNTVTFSADIGAGWLAAMTDKKIWFVTGAARGMGVDIATPPSPRGTPSWPPPQP